MFKNYIKIALRNIKKDKMYSLINILGFASALLMCFLMILTIHDEMSYDNFHLHGDRIYRIFNKSKFEDETTMWGRNPLPLADYLKETYPEITKSSCFINRYMTVKYKNENHKQRIAYITPDFFDIFSFKPIAGNSNKFLRSPSDVVITKAMAEKYFGNANPINKTISIKNEPFQIVGVVTTPSLKSSLQFDFLLSIQTTPGFKYLNNWKSYSSNIFILTNPKTNIKLLDQNIFNIIKGHDPSSDTKFFSQSIHDIHLSGVDSMSRGGNKQFIGYLLIMIIIVVLISCVNYINLATARSMKRAMEIGIRKVVGANKIQIINQIFSESIINALIAFIIAVLFVEILLPNYNTLTGLHIDFQLIENIPVLFGFLILTLFLGTLAGVYPALILSSFKPLVIISGLGMSYGRKGHTMRNILVSFQFIITITFFVFVCIFQNQSSFLMTSNLGFDRTSIIYVRLSEEQKKDYEIIRSELSRIPEITGICGTSKSPGMGVLTKSYAWDWIGKSNKSISYYDNKVDYDFFKIFNMKIKEGRFFSKEFPSDPENGVVINESAADVLSFDSPVGKILKIENEEREIVGVIKDYHFFDLTNEIEPIVLTLSNKPKTLILKINDNANMHSTLNTIKTELKRIHPDAVFNYGILDDFLNSQYPVFNRIRKIVNTCTIFVILILCLGLYGLIAYIAERMAKEIGIRKIMGAGVFKILTSILGKFLTLVIISSFIGLPLGYYFSSRWLESFVYRTSFSIWDFLLPIMLTISITLITIGYQTYKTAISNPIDALRYE